MKPVVFSIHGIRTPGDWQDGAETVLTTFFDYRKIRYTEYRRWAITKLAADLFLLLLCSISVLIVWLEDWIASPRVWAFAVLVGVSAVVLAHYRIKKRLNALVIRIHEDLRHGSAGRGAPAVVAHSLGTLLICQVMERFDGMAFTTIIFTGCVVRSRFAWETMLSRFRYVFNEVGGADRIPYLAAVLGFSIHGMGAAGSKGFSGKVVTKDMLNPSEVGPVLPNSTGCCDVHSGKTSDCVVHNIKHLRITHSGYHEGLAHARDFWLPRLLNMDPVLYRLFHQDCAIVEQAKGGLNNDYRAAIRKVRTTCYGWTAGTLESCAKQQVIAVSKGTPSAEQINELVNGSISVMCQLTTETLQGLEKSPSPVDTSGWKFLDPRIALRDCVASTVEVAVTERIVGNMTS